MALLAIVFSARYIVKINFDSLKLDVYEPGYIKYPNKGTFAASQFQGIANYSVNHQRFKRN